MGAVMASTAASPRILPANLDSNMVNSPGYGCWIAPVSDHTSNLRAGQKRYVYQ
jgi:hypothetical protein